MLSRRSRRDNPVVLVVDAEIRAASQANRTAAAIEDGKPEVADPAINLFNLRVLCPERRVPGRLSFNTYDSKVLPVDPDLAAVEKFAFHSRLNRQDVLRTTRRLLVVHHGESVVIAVK